MIERINQKRTVDVWTFINLNKDYYKDFYITKDKKRVFLYDLKLISKILKKQECYRVYDKGTKAILFIYKEKGYRPYIKILSSNYKYIEYFFKYISWNLIDKELFIKIKKTNPIIKLANKYHWIFKGNRGEEILFFKPKYKSKVVRRENDNYNNQSQRFNKR